MSKHNSLTEIELRTRLPSASSKPATLSVVTEMTASGPEVLFRIISNDYGEKKEDWIYVTIEDFMSFAQPFVKLFKKYRLPLDNT